MLPLETRTRAAVTMSHKRIEWPDGRRLLWIDAAGEPWAAVVKRTRAGEIYLGGSGLGGQVHWHSSGRAGPAELLADHGGLDCICLLFGSSVLLRHRARQVAGVDGLVAKAIDLLRSRELPVRRPSGASYRRGTPAPRCDTGRTLPRSSGPCGTPLGSRSADSRCHGSHHRAVGHNPRDGEEPERVTYACSAICSSGVSTPSAHASLARGRRGGPRCRPADGIRCRRSDAHRGAAARDPGPAPNGRGDMDHRAGRPHSGPRRISDAAPSDPGAWPTVKAPASSFGSRR